MGDAAPSARVDCAEFSRDAAVAASFYVSENGMSRFLFAFQRLRETELEQSTVSGLKISSDRTVATGKQHSLLALPHFGGLVLGRIEADFCKESVILPHFSSSTSVAHFCSAAWVGSKFFPRAFSYTSIGF